ncbi:peptidylprolyl isomerase [Aureibacter tunicatorum]|uniref:Peptidyl-prolyl cis-trans isomerase n=1 Tax=Aureibacter tunicatorum TaxID=866807 RepID=A0AAE3XLS6_9BACT|nr:peptidylprolyl isomerase [Aureibacter tunicatorum]MDR6238319.1 peptidyl-prolyl cis-trans isomerase B (cyclophilin B) [Aureibacter tunicatorum]BDD03351.1 peptidyl-prolyl cis-trans isomerase [Aureibacter tunicatorum]
MKILKQLTLAVVAIALLFSCDKEKDYLVTFHTPYGDMKAVLFDQTPKHKANFIKLAKSGAFDSTTFHRVIQEFMIQGGDVNQKPNSDKKIEYTVSAEFVDTLIHRRGAIAAARQGDRVNPKKESSGSQFYIVQGKKWTEKELRDQKVDYPKLYKYFTHLVEDVQFNHLEEQVAELQSRRDNDALIELMLKHKDDIEKKYDIELDNPYPQERIDIYTTEGGVPHLDDAYTVFGQVVEGMAVIDSIAKQKTGFRDKPVEDIYMSVEVEEIKKKKLIKLYGNLIH